MSQYLKSIQREEIMVSVLIEASKESSGMGAIVNEIMDECDYDDMSITFRVNGVDQMVKGAKKSNFHESYDDCLF